MNVMMYIIHTKLYFLLYTLNAKKDLQQGYIHTYTYLQTYIHTHIVHIYIFLCI